jgi:hypothetical protein
MDTAYFDHLTRSLGTATSRRAILLRLVAAALSLATVSRFLDQATAKKKKRRKLERNAFGCVNVGGKCRGKDANCCSGICQGKKPRKGKKDKSHCVAHDTGTGCQAGQRNQNCGGSDVLCTTSTGHSGICETTTGNAPYCMSSLACVPCAKDVDCQPHCGPQAACVPCSYYCSTPSCVGPELCSGPA